MSTRYSSFIFGFVAILLLATGCKKDQGVSKTQEVSFDITTKFVAGKITPKLVAIPGFS